MIIVFIYQLDIHVAFQFSTFYRTEAEWTDFIKMSILDNLSY